MLHDPRFLFRDPAGVKGHVVHHIAGTENFRRKMAESLVPQVGHARLRGTEEQGGDPVGKDSVDLLGHSEIKTAQACLHVGHRNMQLDGCQGSRQRGIGIAVDHHGRRLPGQKHLFDLLGHTARHGPMAERVDTQMVGGFRNSHLPEEDIGHIVIEMLPGMNQHFGDSSRAEGTAQRRRLDKLGSRPDYGHYFLHQMILPPFVAPAINPSKIVIFIASPKSSDPFKE